MTLQTRDKRALVALTITAAMILIWRATSGSEQEPAATTAAVPVASIPEAEQRLGKLRQIAAAVPGKQQVYEQVASELAQRERGIIVAETAAQAQAQLLQILRRVGRAQASPIDFRNVEIGPVRPFGNDYGEVVVSVSFEGGIEQIVNLLAEITAQLELIATNEVRIGQAHPKQKSMPVRLTVSGIVARRLVPEKKAPGLL